MSRAAPFGRGKHGSYRRLALALSVGTIRCLFASSWSPADRANAWTATSPADDTRFGSSNTADVARSAGDRCIDEMPFVLVRIGP